jgi:tubulin monoglycylase TTLL3/8
MVNHYSRNGCFTTKVGLCNILRNLQWFHSGCADQFFPRCYKLSHEDDKVAFVGKVHFFLNKSFFIIFLQMIIV